MSASPRSDAPPEAPWLHGAALAELLELVRSAADDDTPQHALVLGSEGVGKSVLLRRLADAVRADTTLGRGWEVVTLGGLPSRLRGLGDLWRDVLAELDVTDAPDEAADAHTDEEVARAALEQTLRARGTRLLLLVDRLDHVLARVEADVEASRLRELLQESDQILLVGASREAIAATYRYDQPFYELFRLVELEAPSLRDARTLMGLHLHARSTTRRPGGRREAPLATAALQALGVTAASARDVAKTMARRRLGTGQLPELLEAAATRRAEAFEARLEHLAPQARGVLCAAVWPGTPQTAQQVAERQRLTRPVASGQLHRLVARGLLVRVEPPPGGGRTLRFEVADRAFGLWCRFEGGRAPRDALLATLTWWQRALEDPTDEAVRALAELTEDADVPDAPAAAPALAMAAGAARAGQGLALQRFATAALAEAPDAAATHLALAAAFGRAGEVAVAWAHARAAVELAPEARAAREVARAVAEASPLERRDDVTGWLRASLRAEGVPAGGLWTEAHVRRVCKALERGGSDARLEELAWSARRAGLWGADGSPWLRVRLEGALGRWAAARDLLAEASRAAPDDETLATLARWVQVGRAEEALDAMAPTSPSWRPLTRALEALAERPVPPLGARSPEGHAHRALLERLTGSSPARLAGR